MNITCRKCNSECDELDRVCELCGASLKAHQRVPIRFVYADPPYLGCAKAHYSKDPSGIKAEEVNHAELIGLLNTYDAWALSTHTPGLRTLLPMCPADVRVGAWVKPFASFKPGVNPAYAWEAIIFRGARKRNRNHWTIRDWVSANITLKKGTHGAKPPGFCFWMFELMGLTPSDELIDLYPGSGVVSASWEIWKRTASLFPTRDVPDNLEELEMEYLDTTMRGCDGK